MPDALAPPRSPAERRRRVRRGWIAAFTPRLAWALVLPALLGAGCRKPSVPSLTVEPLPAPESKGPLAPQLIRLADGTLLASWLEGRPGGGYSLRMSSRWDRDWSSPQIVAGDAAMAMFATDLPGVAEAPGGTLVAHWEVTVAGADPYATEIHLAISTDHGATWSGPLVPYRGGTPAQHGFVSTFPVGGALGLVWLDGGRQRYVPASSSASPSAPRGQWLGAMGLQFTTLTPDGTLGTQRTIDPITCAGCPTAAALTTRGPIVVYRGRAAPPGADPARVRDDEPAVRDIRLARLEGRGWARPRLVHPDGWVADGCPDNGPAVAADGNRVVVAWWTGAGGSRRVNVGFSVDAGDHFAEPTSVDHGNPEGQVTIALARYGAVVGWLENGETWARWVGIGGLRGPAVSLGPAPHHSRLPRWIGEAEGAVAAWMERGPAGKNVLRMARLAAIFSASWNPSLGCCAPPAVLETAPVPPTSATAPAISAAGLQQGRLLFGSYGCALCHGESGAGDGRLAHSLPTRPRDLRDPAAFRQGTSVAAISSSIARGVPGTSMPAHGFIPPADRELLASFILSFRASPSSDGKRP